MSQTRLKAGRTDIGEILAVESPEGLVAVAAEGTILFWNRAAQAIFEYSWEEALGRPFFDLFPTYASHPAAELKEAMERALAAGPLSLELLGTKKSGSTVKVALSFQATKRPRGAPPF